MLFFYLIPLSFNFCISPDHSFNSNELLEISFEAKRTEEIILKQIQAAKKSIYISLYGLKNKKITDALIDAHYRGIDVQLSSELDSESSESWQQLIQSDIPISFGNVSGIMHNKYWLFDERLLVTGSSNFSQTMFRDYNNTVVINSKNLVAEYLRDFRIQRSGAYSRSKDLAFKIFQSSTGNSTWKPVWVKLNNSISVSAWFTPYSSTIFYYKKNLNNYIDCSDACFSPKNCRSQLISNCSDWACFDYKKNKVFFRYNHYDKDYINCNQLDNAFNVVIPLLENAKKNILVLAFSLQDRVLIDRFIQLAQKGIKIKIYIDYSQYRVAYRNSIKSFQKLASEILENGFLKITRRINGGLLHHKVIVIDQNLVLLGSMNFSQSAVKVNDENFLIFKNAQTLAWEFYQEANRINKESYLLPNTESFDYN